MRTASAVSREELEKLVGTYRHLRDERRRAGPGGHTRRRLDHELERVHERFERLLVEAVPDEETRTSWRAHLHHDAPEPAEPAPVATLLFRGRSAAGSVLEIRQRLPDELEVVVDGTAVERLADADELRSTLPGLELRVAGAEFREVFEASKEALAALALMLDFGTPPPARLVHELLLDGLVDRNLGLTPRGRRAIA